MGMVKISMTKYSLTYPLNFPSVPGKRTGNNMRKRGDWMRKRLWLPLALAVVLSSWFLLPPQAKRPTTQGPATFTRQSGQLPGTPQAPRALTRQQIAAQDIARTTALAVRDHRYRLQQLANQLQHTTRRDQQQWLMQQAMRAYPPLRSLRLIHFPSDVLQLGSTPNPRVNREVVEKVKNTQTFYLADLYSTTSGGKEELWMSMGVPLCSHSRIIGVLTADASMDWLRGVAQKVDSEMATRTVLHSQDGSVIQMHAGAPVPAVKDHPARVQAEVDGARWKTASIPGQSLRQKPRLRYQEVIVRFAQPPSREQEQAMLREIDGICVKKNRHHTGVYRSRSKTVAQLMQYFRAHGAVHVEPNRLYHPNEVPNDVLYQRYQWNLPQIHTDTAWQISTGNPGVVIAVVDTGVDLSHPEFQGQLVTGYNVLEQNNDPQDDNGHGTHVAGIIAARTNNVEGIAGIDWHAKIMPVKTMAADGSGSVFDIADGIEWAVDHGAQVINLSLGEYEDSPYLHDAIRYAHDKNVLVVAAMGNDGTNQPSYPAAYPEVLAVCATDEQGNRADFSNYGYHAGISAPGVSIASTYPGHRYAALSGTSMAAPHISGVAALMRTINPLLTADQVKEILERTATDAGPAGKDPYFGAGLVNVQAALQAAEP